ncbi:hypothetical protein J2X45_001744 [Caulobacter sp. BE264]|uniref:Pycsar system effector family protein n=1 Tax=Caulobacter sp. BE264 TaxID=2817724 RepID=UPI002866A86A|nr:Pycsar system effector family protein [Caulobacter sp. BE264]MDR7230653.1 hypothetical protein [Caulobacter sp. BE264]
MAIPSPREYALAQFDRLQGFFPRAEGKAAFLFALNVGMAGVLAANVPVKKAFTHATIPAWACLALLALSTAWLYGTFFPHLDGAKHKGIIYFKDIAEVSADDFIEKVKRYTEDDLEQDALCQVWRNAEILKKKYDRVKYAFRATGLSLPLWLVYISIVASTGATPILKAG